MRFRFALVTMLSAASGLLFLLACNSDTAAPADGGAPSFPTDGSSGTSSGSTSSSGSSGSGTTVGDAGRAQNGCLLFATDLKSGAKIENIAHPGAINWTNVEGALKEDGSFATIALDDNQESAELHVSDFGFTVPPNAETWGIVVELMRRAVTNPGILQTSNVNVVIPSKPSQYKFDNPSFFWPHEIDGKHPYGQGNDTWGVDLYPADVNAAGFGATLTVKKGPDGGPGPISGRVDALRVAVYYADGDAAHCKR
jgi:hypothetical protein